MSTVVGTNVKVDVQKNKLTIEVDLSAKRTPSHSGKTEIIASTLGNAQIQPGIFLGLNLYSKK